MAADGTAARRRPAAGQSDGAGRCVCAGCVTVRLAIDALLDALDARCRVWRRGVSDSIGRGDAGSRDGLPSR